MSRWIEALIAPLLPSFGGFVTFCEDPDGLLELADVREALRAKGVNLGDWNGSIEALAQWTTLPDDEKPLVLVRDGAKRHLAETHVSDNRWESVSVGGLMPRFSSEVVKAIPTAFWDRLMVLHDQERYKRPPQETAILIGRALYGVDPEYLKHGDGWTKLLLTIATNGEGLPLPIAKATAELMPAPKWLGPVTPFDVLTEPSLTRSAIVAAIDKPSFSDAMLPSEQLLIDAIAASPTVTQSSPDAACNLVSEWNERCTTAEAVLEFGLLYAKMLDQAISKDDRLCVNRMFADWLKTNYGLIQSAPNPAILRLPTLVRQLDAEVGAGRLLLLVVDALGLHAWNQVKSRWITEGIFGSEHTRAAFAVLPTITVLSRRALFEGKLPISFSDQEHSQALERKLWTERFGTDAQYFNVREDVGIADSLSLGKRRVCIIDVSWDKMAHSIDPKFGTIKGSAETWAGRTALRNVIRRGLDCGYRVFLTADHGQIECFGKGRPSVGVLPEERSRRAMLFSDDAVCRSFETDWSTAFTPTGLQKGNYSLFADDLNSFDLVGAGTVSHGGLSIDEVLVPVAEVFA
jgi:hypothetical protein